MAKYTVRMREVHVQYVEIEADNPEQAIKKVKDGDGEYVMLEYSHTQDSDSWDVENTEGDIVRDQYPGVGRPA